MNILLKMRTGKETLSGSGSSQRECEKIIFLMTQQRKGTGYKTIGA